MIRILDILILGHNRNSITCHRVSKDFKWVQIFLLIDLFIIDTLHLDLTGIVLITFKTRLLLKLVQIWILSVISGLVQKTILRVELIFKIWITFQGFLVFNFFIILVNLKNISQLIFDVNQTLLQLTNFINAVIDLLNVVIFVFVPTMRIKLIQLFLFKLDKRLQKRVPHILLHLIKLILNVL